MWSLRSWPSIVSIAGREYEVPALSAMDWLTMLMGDNLYALDLFTEILDPDDLSEIDEQLLNGTLSMEELQDVALELVGMVSARDWWVTLRLIGTARGGWHVLGPEMLKRTTTTHLSLAAWLDVLTVVIVDMMKADTQTMFWSKIQMTPPEVAAKITEDDMVMDRDAWLALSR